MPSSLVPDVGPLLSLAGEPSFPSLKLPLAEIRVQAHQVLNTRPSARGPSGRSRALLWACSQPSFYPPSPALTYNTPLVLSSPLQWPLDSAVAALLHLSPPLLSSAPPPTLQLFQPATITISDDSLAPDLPAVEQVQASDGPPAEEAPRETVDVAPVAPAACPRRSSRI